MAKEGLGGHPLDGQASWGRTQVDRAQVDVSAQPEVGDFHRHLFRQEDVPRCQVPVDHLIL